MFARTILKLQHALALHVEIRTKILDIIPYGHPRLGDCSTL